MIQGIARDRPGPGLPKKRSSHNLIFFYNQFMRWMHHPVARILGHFIGSLLCVALARIILIPFESYLDIETIVPLYLLPVMVSTALWGLMPGILAALTAFFVFNYFYFEPYHTLQVHKTQDIITLIIFLIVAVVISQLIGRTRQGMRLAQSREWEATRMYELLTALSGLQDERSIARELADLTLKTFQLDHVELSVVDEASNELTIHSGDPGSLGAESQSMEQVLRTARGEEGVMHIWHHRPPFSPQEARLLDAYLNQGALALERVRLTRSENKSHVLEESDRLKSSLLNSVSHELRTPLAVIKASVSSIRMDQGKMNEEARQDLLATIEEETDHLNLLVGNLLDMSRIESGALIPKKEWNSIEEIAVGVAAKMRKHLHSHQITMNFPDDLPLVPTDYVLIGQVFMNLISNSVKYAPEDTTITISAANQGDFLHVIVANQGPPVPTQHLERIFDKFNRLTESAQVTGTGLGLSICKGIIETHGGRIWAENREGNFEFHFSIPTTMDGTLPIIPREESVE